MPAAVRRAAPQLDDLVFVARERIEDGGLAAVERMRASLARELDLPGHAELAALRALRTAPSGCDRGDLQREAAAEVRNSRVQQVTYQRKHSFDTGILSIEHR